MDTTNWEFGAGLAWLLVADVLRFKAVVVVPQDAPRLADGKSRPSADPTRVPPAGEISTASSRSWAR